MSQEKQGYDDGVIFIENLVQEQLRVARRKVRQFDYEFNDLMNDGVSMENHMVKSVLFGREFYRGQSKSFEDILRNIEQKRSEK